jgi:hypothetical protein
MPFNLLSYLKDFYLSLFRSKGTPARLSAKRVFLLCFLFLAFPFWNAYIRLGLFLDNLLYPDYKSQESPDPIFIIGNYRSGSTFFHRLLLQDQQFTCLKAWEIYFAPAIVHRKFIRFILKISKMVGSPVQKVVKAFDRLMNNIYSMHKTGLYTYEQDSQLYYHTWSSFNLFAIFPFPEQVKKYIYYDQLVPEKERKAHFGYYRGVLQRHLHLSATKRYLSKNPDFTPAVNTLLDEFPRARFINLVRSPEGMIPSAINLWASNWKAYGTPGEKYPLTDVIKEYARHWYIYPHQQLSGLPADRYSVVYFSNLVNNPVKEVTRIYHQFGLELRDEFREILEEETIKSRNYDRQNNYSLEEMGQQKDALKREFAPALEGYSQKITLDEPVLERG